ncbi:DUF4390 domain-containing protein [Desulfurivibrio alkaliphilus]|uniref:DUF4390 domain-containing protein n=1 Tax=Desulfurivibrio alkaliphilus (strain DSM 19089 / UNIQEM U267 / AHT2) TaxID=589865 RepID=D6Z6T7_DESAT|nr:DUF4390 domain-containing protein [Desulfurivibrio alkaliphilus]ADH85046.1 conserved hypothetical protein [Desulfurivibrio alkaliphilus AHT 2]
MRIFPGLLCWLAVIILLLPGPSVANEGRIDEMVVTNSDREVLLYFQVRDFMTPEMEEGVKSGLPLTMIFLVELHRQRWGWRDRKLVELEFTHVLSYDSLKDEYRVTREEEEGRVVSTASLAEARRLLGRVSGLAVLPLSELEPDQTYSLSAKARLAEKSRPPLLGRLLPFRRLWSFETDWHSVEFYY